MRRDRVVDVLHLLAVVGAVANPIGPPTEGHAVGGRPPAVELIPVAWLPEVHGASDLARDPSGRLWVVTERTHLLAPIDGGPPLPIVGVPEDTDLEALAFTGDGQLLIGTERDEHRTTDYLLEARIEGDRVVVTATRTVDYAALGVEVQPNHGIEGLCVAGAHQVLALEDPAVEDDERLGILVVDGRVVRVRLRSETGKLSALTCSEVPGGLKVWAIERHFGVARLLRMMVPLPASGAQSATTTPAVVELAAPAPLEAVLWADLAPAFAVMPNVEGLAEKNGALYLADDDAPSPPGTVTTILRVVRTSTSG